MSALNNVTIQGRLARDPEIKTTNSGKHIGITSVFIENSFPTEDNPGGFMDIVCFEQKADFLEKYFKKGDQIIICGSLKNESWSKEGAKFNKWSIIVNNIHFSGKRTLEQNNDADYRNDMNQKRSYNPQNNQDRHSEKKASYNNSYNENYGIDEEIPF